MASGVRDPEIALNAGLGGSGASGMSTASPRATSHVEVTRSQVSLPCCPAVAARLPPPNDLTSVGIAAVSPTPSHCRTITGVTVTGCHDQGRKTDILHRHLHAAKAMPFEVFPQFFLATVVRGALA